MQLGELQSQIERFERRNASIIALSVDAPTDSLAMIARLGLTFELASDPEQQVVRAFRVQNPDTQELALHAVYIAAADGTIFYRKVARRRPTSEELIDAIDAFNGDYPRDDARAAPSRIAVAYPQNNYQALLEVADAASLPASVDRAAVTELLRSLREESGDDALIRFKAFCRASPDAGEADLLRVVAWLVRQRFFAEDAEALAAGQRLQQRLTRVRELERARREAGDDDREDEVLQSLARARAGLSLERGAIDAKADEWRLRYVKTSLRSYREVVLAELRRRS